MLLVLCDDAVAVPTRDWFCEALCAGMSAAAGEVSVWAHTASMSPAESSGEPCVVWLTSSAERDAIHTAAAAAVEIVLLLGTCVGVSAARGDDRHHGALAWQAAAAAAVPRVAVWLPAPSGGRGDPTGELSEVLRADRVVRLKRLGTRGATRRVQRLGGALTGAACAPQRLDRSDGAVRRRNAARAATDALEDLLAESDVEEFQIRGGESMLVQYAGGRVERRPSPFSADEDLIEAVRFLAGYSGDRPQRFDELDPRLDVRVGDRWRLHAEAFVTSPPNVVLRSNMAGRIRLDELGVASPELNSLLVEAITGRVRANVVVAAAMGGGKTTLCQALLAAVPAHERIDTIEDTPELRLHEYGIHPNTYERLTRDPNQDGHGRHSMADHIRDAKRANAAKLVVGEIRGEGCEALLDAMSSGLDGCLVTLHSQPGQGVLEKLVAYACSEGAEPDYARRQIASAVDLCVWLGRNDAGDRVVADVTQLTGIDQMTGVISTTCLWALHPGDRWATPRGRPVGRVAAVYAAAGVAADDIGVPIGATLFSRIVDAPAPDSALQPSPAAVRAAALRDGSAPHGVALPAAVSVGAADARNGSTDHGAGTHASASTSARGAHDGPLLSGPLFDAPSCERAERSEVMWDPGPLVPIDNPPPYEPLVAEDAAC
ncbi:ATPase, T2SS/T4P/T4SS family [Candidatus Poriferisodalis sp.]|uniref:ATPase, T2SS/T4P/T4SS family n=1 Tax=Candidatus Poriferisodalis sp. TaxID=3101277 RepID=UPI003B026EE6